MNYITQIKERKARHIKYVPVVGVILTKKMQIFYQILIFVYTASSQNLEEIGYYENLIKQQMEEAMNYKPLTNNSQYIPDSLEVEGGFV